MCQESPRVHAGEYVNTREVNSVAIGQRAEDGYVNLTKIVKAAGKQLGHYRENQATQDFLEALAADIGIPISELLQVRKGGNPDEQGTWAHPQIAIHCGQWCSPEFAVLVSKWVFEWMSQGKAPALQPQISQLDQLEMEIYEGLELMEAGRARVWQAAAKIQAEQLYKDAGFKSFEDYCRIRWGWKRSNAWEIAKAGKVTNQLSEAGIAPEKLPSAVAHIRPLLKLEPERIPDVWQDLVESAEHEITTSTVETAVNQRFLSSEEVTDFLEIRSTVEECRILFRRAIAAINRMDAHNTRNYLAAAHSRLSELFNRVGGEV